MKEHRRKYNEKLKLEDDFFSKFGKLDDEVYYDGAIDKKHKELMGLAISVATRCNECICYHIEGCFNARASHKIGGIGGVSITYPNARFAMEMLEEIYK